MKVVLYDEGMYPSGSAHGMVVATNPEFAARGITITGEPGKDRALTELPDDRYLVLRKTGGTIRRAGCRRYFKSRSGEAFYPSYP